MKIVIKILLLTAVYLTSIEQIQGSEIYPYISPGVKLGFGKSGVTISPKISVGVNTVFHQQPIFINVTYGRNINIVPKVYPLKNGYRYTEVEAGVFNVHTISVGGGAGVAFPIGIKGTIIPKISFFIGYFAFIRTDHVIYEKKLYNDFGAVIVAPFGSIFYLWD